MSGIISKFGGRVFGALSTLPSLRDCLECLLAIALFGVLAWWITQGASWTGGPSSVGLFGLLIVFLAPALLEEIVFRGALLPRAEELPVAPWGPVIFSLILFVLWHPLNAWLLMPQARGIFTDPLFLLMAALLGGVASLLYLRSQSIWTPVIFHGAIVAGWKLTGAPSFLFVEGG